MAAGVRTSGRTRAKGPRARGAVAFGVLTTLMFLVVAARLVQLQVVEYAEHTREITNIIIKPTSERDRRGQIVDSRGVVLAASVPVRACALAPKLLIESEGANQDKVVARLADALELTPVEIQKLTDRINRRYVPKNSETGGAVPYRFVWVKRRVTDEQYGKLAAEIERAKREARNAWQNRRRWLKLAGEMKVARDPEKEAYCRTQADGWRAHALAAEGRYAGVFFPPEFERFYPQAELASHVLGFSDIDGNGMGGIELVLNNKLSGKPVTRLVARDARSRPLMSLISDDRSPAGMTVELTIDSVVQAIVEEELKSVVEDLKIRTPDINAHAVVIDPYTGDILAIANYPTYDPNHPRVDPETGEKIGDRARRNDVVSAIQAPGSTFKPLMICAALEEKVASLEEEVDCSTFSMNNGKRTIKDIYPYSRMSLEMAVVKSSNPAMVRTGLKLGPEKMREYVLKFGFGEKTGSGLPGESRGMITSAEKWNEWTMGSVPMGYEIGVTTLQMAAAYSAIANGGMLPTPNLIRAVYDANGGLVEKPEPVMRRRVISPETAEKMRGVMRKVITTGTGRRANIEEYHLGGKTGTANMMVTDEEKAKGMKGYAQGKRHTANFVALAPWDKPRAIVCVSIRGTDKFGGEASSPPGAAIARRILGYWGVPTANGSPIRADIMPRREFKPAPPPIPVEYTIGTPDDDNYLGDEVDDRWMEDMVYDPEAIG
ncbi:MAG: penicillin-binding protein 2 [Planctomycetaceae bacterium]|nr:penicillin-binding protein 2 [Planctomycetaceae bacterium]